MRSGRAQALLLRNHGVLVAERDVRWAVLASALLERTLHVQLLATGSARCTRFPRRCSTGFTPTKYQDGFAGEYWDAWVRELRRRGRAFGMPGSRLMDLSLTVNGPEVRESRRAPGACCSTSCDERLRLTGAKRSCDVQVCGTCTVLVDGAPGERVQLPGG